MKPQSPDNVCTEFADRARSLAIRLADPSTVLIEGDPESLRFLGELLVAQASYESDCGFEISPKGPGSAFFANRSGLGLYVHRIPCPHAGSSKQRLPNTRCTRRRELPGPRQLVYPAAGEPRTLDRRRLGRCC
jgi:hypothetical protein